MARKTSHHTHVPTKLGLGILGLLVIGVVFAIPQLSQEQDVRTQASTVIVVTPSTACKEGVNSFGTSNACGDNNFRQASYTCYDGFSGALGGSASCKSSAAWQQYAIAACKGHSTCSPTSTPTLPPKPTGQPTGVFCKSNNECANNETCVNRQCTAFYCPVAKPDSCDIWEVANHQCAEGSKPPGTLCKNGAGQTGTCSGHICIIPSTAPSSNYR